MTKTKRKCEVLVVGGGTSGISAAIGASSLGAEVLLIEKDHVCGGVAATGLNQFICGLYANGKNVPRRTLNEGIAREICSRLEVISSIRTVMRIGKVFVLPFLAGDLMSVFRSLIAKEKNLEISYDTCAVSIKTVKNIIKEVRVKSSKGTFNVIPKVVVDCSGEGDIVRLSGNRYQLTKLNRRQLAGYSIRVKGVSNTGEMTAVKVPYYIRKAIGEKKLASYLQFTTVSFVEGTDEGIIKLSVGPIDGIHNIDRVRRDAHRVQDYLVSAIPSFNRSRIIAMSSEVFNREGLRVNGEYTLKTTDVIKARKFPDGVVKNAWPIELWDQKKGPQYRYLRSGEHYQIPVRCLKAKEILNLYCAGRCISVSHEALGSTRVMGTCMSLGEQAGLAAAKSIHNGD